MTKIISKLFLFITLLSPFISAQSDVDKAWTAFSDNNRVAALGYLNSALTADSTDKRALLTLTLYYATQMDDEKSREYFFRFLRHSDNQYPYIYAQWLQTAIYQGAQNTKAVRDMYQSVIDKPDAQGLLRVMANGQMGDYYQRIKDFDKSAEYYKGINSIDEWMVTGPFDNISASGYDKVFPPETEFEPKKSYSGMNGIPVNWFKIKEVRSDRWVDFTRYFNRQGAVYYANSFVYSEKAQKVQIRIGTSGSLRFFLNDQMVIDVFDENNNDADTYIVETTLQKGWNRLLVKCGFSQIDRCNFLFRITNSGGEPVQGLKFSTEKQKYAQQKNVPFNTVPAFAIEYFKNQIQINPTHYENYFLLVNAYLRNDMGYEAELTIRPLLTKLNYCSFLRHKMIEVFARSRKSDELETEFETLSRTDKGYPEVLMYMINESFNNEDLDEVEKLLMELGNTAGHLKEYYELKMKYYSVKEQNEKVYELVQEAVKKFPDYLSFHYYQALFSINKNQTYSGAAAIFEEYCKTNYDISGVQVLANYYLQAGDKAKWEETLREYLLNLKASPGVHFEIGKKFFEMREYQKAADEFNAALEYAPNSPAFFEKAADCYLELGDKAKATVYYSAALKYEPSNYTVREKLRNLQGKTPLASLFSSSDYKELIKNPDTPAGTDNYILLNDQKRIVYKSGSSEVAGELLVRTVTKKGIDLIKEYSIPYNPYTEGLTIEKAVTIKKDNAEIKADVDRNYVVFKSLEQGDHIYIKWKIKNYYSGKLSDQFWDEFNFEYSFPSKLTRYALLAEDNFVFNHKTQFMDNKPVVKKLDGFTLYEWSLADVPALKSEPAMPMPNDVAKRLFISSIPGWNYLVDWYKDLTRNKTRITYEIEEVVAEIIPEPDKLTDEEKIEIVYNYITENIRYSSVAFRQSGLIPQEARDVLVTRIGDCKDVATLCITMLKVLGIESYYVLINTKDEGFNKNVLPSIGFNHCIVALEGKSGLKFLDLTAHNFHYKSLPELDINGLYLLIKDGITSAGHVPDNGFYPDNIIRNTTIIIKDNDGISGTTTTTKTGLQAAYSRYAYRYQSEEEQTRKLKEALVEEYPELRLIGFVPIGDFSEITPEIGYIFTFEIPNYLSEAGDYRLLKLPWSDKLLTGAELMSDTRIHPLLIWNSEDTLSEVMSIELPSGYEPVETSYNQKYDCSAASFSISIEYKDNKLYSNRQLVYKTREVNAEDFAAYKDFCTKVIKADTKQILLKKKE